jgi:hypothetical protein
MAAAAKPFVHKPDKYEAVGDELFCFYDDQRLCNGSCVAYDLQGSTDEKRTSCILVNAEMQQAASLVGILKILRTKESASIPGSNIPPPR